VAPIGTALRSRRGQYALAVSLAVLFAGALSYLLNRLGY
jgi:hypothetical protein